MQSFLVTVAMCMLNLAHCNSLVSRKINLDNQDEYFQGDILIKNKKFQLRAGVSGSELWDNSVIYYEMAYYWGPKQKRILADSIKEIQDNTCIRFVQRINQTNYVRIVNGTGCASYVGRIGGVQEINLLHSSRDTCWVHETVVHELLHAIGLHHEHMREDRDDHLYIFPGNVDRGKEPNFYKCNNPRECNNYGLLYNYLSIMHYSMTAFSKHRKITMLPKDELFANAMGHSKTGHPLDYEAVRRMYKCHKQNVTCSQCETMDGENDCNGGSCTGEACYTAIWKDKTVKGCGDLVYTFVGCKDASQLGGCNVICACTSDHCNEKLSSHHLPSPMIPCAANYSC